MSLETIRRQKRAEALSATARFCLILMAEKERFELSVLSYTRVPGVHLKPLGHLSVIGTGQYGPLQCGSLIYPERRFFTTEN